MLRNSVSRRPLIFITLGLLILAAVIVGLSSKTALADEGVSIRGNFTVAISFIQDPSTCGVGDKCVACVTNFPPRFYIDAEGIGDTSRLGTMFLKIQKVSRSGGEPVWELRWDFHVDCS